MITRKTVSDTGAPTDGSGPALSSLTLAHTVDVGPDRLLIAIVCFNNDFLETVSTVQWDPTGVNEALTFLAAGTRDDDARCEIWYLRNPTEGSFDLVATLDATLGSPDHGFALFGVSYIGVDQATTFRASVGNNGSSAAPTTGAITSFRSDEVIAAMTAESLEAFEVAIDAPAVEIAERESGDTGLRQTSNVGVDVGAAPNVTIDWTIVSDHWAVAGTSLIHAPVLIDMRRRRSKRGGYRLSTYKRLGILKPRYRRHFPPTRPDKPNRRVYPHRVVRGKTPKPKGYIVRVPRGGFFVGIGPNVAGVPTGFVGRKFLN